MDRLQNTDLSATPPVATTGTTGYPRVAVPGGVAASSMHPYYLYMLIEELRAVVTAGGVTPEFTTLTQVQESIAAQIADATPAASDTVAGLAERATTAEVLAGTDDERFVTPAGVSAALGVATGGFSAWTGGTIGSDQAGDYYEITTTEPGYSEYYDIEEVPTDVTVALALSASSSGDDYTIEAEFYDTGDTLLETKTVADITAGNATPAIVNTERVSTTVDSSAVKCRLKFTVSLGVIKVYVSSVTSTAGIGYGSLSVGTGVVLGSVSTSTFDLSLSDTKQGELRIAGTGNITTTLTDTTGSLGSVGENVSVSSGDYIQVYTREWAGVFYCRTYKNGVAVGSERSLGSGYTGTVTLTISVDGTLTSTGTF